MANSKSTPHEQLKRIIRLFNIFWTLIFIGAYAWGLTAEKKVTLSLARKEAEASFNKDLVYRRWAAGHGGVYVPTTEDTPPNPYLKHVPERDIITPSGIVLTLINPAYMTRQVYELAGQQYGVLGHITSLNPIRPANKPDAWEARVLEEFAKGKDETSSVESIEGKPYLRYMKRLVTENRCLKCHAVQGYKEGDIRGGISTSVPLSGYYEIYSKFKLKQSLILFPIWLVGVLFFNMGTRMLGRQLQGKEKIQEQLAVQSEILNKSQEIAHLGSWHLDIKKNILTWSDENYRLFGRSKDKFQCTYEAFLDTVHPDDREMVNWTYKNAVTNRLPYECIHRIIRDDGEIRIVHEKSEEIVDSTGETIHSFGFTQDITEKSKLESELMKYQQMVSTADEQMAFVDENYTFLAVNDAYLKAYEINREEIVGHTIADLLGHDVFEKYVKAHFDRCLAGKEVRYQEWFAYPKKGKRFMDVAYYGHYQSDGSMGGVVVSIRDITDLKKAEAESIAFESRLQQAQKMEAIGTLAGGIAHDFNNVLGAILGYTDMAKEDAPPDSRFAKDLDNVLIAANRAKDLVKQILVFSRQTKADRVPLKIEPLIKEGLKMLRPSIPSTISITENIDPNAGPVLADPTQVHQILMNLCTNAYHAMESTGGTLSISLKSTFIGTYNQKNITHLTPGEYVELIVSDTGVGMGADIINKIFDPYFTTKKIGKGTGLGLAIIHGIMEEYGGTINVESQIGKGATFHVYFPVIEKDAVPPTKGSDDIPRGNERILLIDDEELLAEMGRDMLERLGYYVTARRSSIEALTTFQNTPNDFDVVITDQTMPDMTGAELAKRMMQIRPDIPIILCTGYSNLIDEDSAKALGIKEFVLKPLSKGVIAKLIRKVLDGKE